MQQRGAAAYIDVLMAGFRSRTKDDGCRGADYRWVYKVYTPTTLVAAPCTARNNRHRPSTISYSPYTKYLCTLEADIYSWRFYPYCTSTGWDAATPTKTTAPQSYVLYLQSFPPADSSKRLICINHKGQQSQTYLRSPCPPACDSRPPYSLMGLGKNFSMLSVAPTVELLPSGYDGPSCIYT